MTDPLRAAILGDGETPCSKCKGTGRDVLHSIGDIRVWHNCPHCDSTGREPWNATAAAARVRAMLTSDEAVERAAKGAVASDSALKQWDDFGERGLVNAEEWMVSPETGRNWWRGIARAAILAAMGDPT